MASTRIRVLTLCASSLVTAVLVAAFFVWRRPRSVDSVHFESIDSSRLFGDHPSAPAPPAPARSDVLSATSPLFPPSMIKRRPLTYEELRLLYPNDGRYDEYDPQVYYRYRAHTEATVEWPEHPLGHFVAHTNGLGLREEREVLEQQPDLRVLAIGDSHTDGVCFAEETYPNVLERALSAARPGKIVEALNAGVGGYSFYNYLGALERYLPLAPDVVVIGVYGGNDFEESLTLHHLFQGTTRPPGVSAYGDQITAAFEVSSAAMGQAFVALKYFAHNPDQIEVALQCARDVATEIVVTCVRQGAHPIFVYIPPMHSVEGELHRELFEKLAAALKLSATDMRVTDRMADSYLAYLRTLHVDVLDMRPEFAAANEELYWQDQHINLRGHERIARALLPLVDAARPPNAVRVRQVGTPADFATGGKGGAAQTRAVAPATEFVADAAPPQAAVKVADKPLKQVVLSRDEVGQLFRLRTDQEFDERSLFRYASKLTRTIGGVVFATNSIGVLGAEEPSSSQPSVLLLGDETVFAPGDDGATCGALIERAHGKVKCLDGCTAGYGLFNYLGTLERLRDQQPTEVVVVVDTTTDVGDVIPVYRATQLERDSKRATPETRSTQEQRRDDEHPASGRDRLIEVARGFHEKPGSLLIATRYAAEVVLEISRRCKARNVPLTVVVLPSASDPRVRGVVETIASARGELASANEDLMALTRLHAAFIATLEAHAITVIDFGITLAQAPLPLIDAATLRLNANGRAALAELIAGRLSTPR